MVIPIYKVLPYFVILQHSGPEVYFIMVAALNLCNTLHSGLNIVTLLHKCGSWSALL